jgi:hypothetical protein
VFDTIILLTGPAEQIALGALLRSHNPQLIVQPVTTLADVEALEPTLLARARLIGFTTPVIVAPTTSTRDRPSIQDGRRRISRSTTAPRCSVRPRM